MRSTHVQAFLSCSFDTKDKAVVDYFNAICRGIDVRCVNVDKGYVAVPPDQARQLIADSQVLIAIATQRDEIKPGKYLMPKAVDEEMAMAYANKKPILLFVEKGVDTETGFVRNYCTYQEFERTSLHLPAFVEKAVACIHNCKVDVISPEQLHLAQHGQEHIYAEWSRWLIELVELPNRYTWRYSNSRRLRFSARLSEPIKAAAWAAVVTKDASSDDMFKWSAKVHDGSKAFRMQAKEEKVTHNFCEISFDIDPKPEADDFIEYSIQFESPFLNPIYAEDAAGDHASIVIDGTKYLCYDGLIPIVRVQEMKVQMRFPAAYPMQAKEVVPFVGSYVNRVDYIVATEIKRMTVNRESFGGNIVVDLSIQSPLLQHLYGVAWNPPKRPKKVCDGS